MAIPDTEVRLYKGIPWDNTYTDVRLFKDAAERDSFFAASAASNYFVSRFTDFSYQRIEGRDVIKVGVHADTIRNVNYLGFKNSTLNKWFYAFVVQVNYINPNCSEIVYELDHFQNWYYAATLQKSIVLRRHASKDEECYGYWLKEEQEPGTYLPTYGNILQSLLTEEEVGPNSYIECLDLGDHGSPPAKPRYQHSIEIGKKPWYVVVVTNEFDVTSGSTKTFWNRWNPYCINSNKWPAEEEIFFQDNGCYSSNVFIWQIPLNTDPKAITTIMDDFLLDMSLTWDLEEVNKLILDAYLSPLSIKEAGTSTSKKCWGAYEPYLYSTQTAMKFVYTPRNCKLFCYPFRKIQIMSPDGNTFELEPEKFNPYLKTKFSFYPTVRACIIPEVNLVSYSNQDAGIDPSKVIAYQYHNSAGLSSNTILNQTAQFQKEHIPEVLNNLTTGLATMAMGGQPAIAGINALSTSVKQGINWSAEYRDAKKVSSSSVTKVNSGDLAWFTDKLKFYVRRLIPTLYDVERLDSYFDYYGYNWGGALEKLTLNNRKYWDYARTANCLITGNIPQESKKAIEAIFNKGARFWHVVPDGTITENPALWKSSKPELNPQFDKEGGGGGDDPTYPYYLDSVSVPLKGQYTETQGFAAYGEVEAGKFHTGWDITGDANIYSIGNGRVGRVVANGQWSGWGNITVAEHIINNGKYGESGYKEYYVYSIYGHQRLTVKEVDPPLDTTYPYCSITNDTLLGYMGNTGGDYGTHLHLGLISKKDGSKMDMNSMQIPHGYLTEDTFDYGVGYMIDNASNGYVYYNPKTSKETLFKNMEKAIGT